MPPLSCLFNKPVQPGGPPNCAWGYAQGDLHACLPVAWAKMSQNAASCAAELSTPVHVSTRAHLYFAEQHLTAAASAGRWMQAGKFKSGRQGHWAEDPKCTPASHVRRSADQKSTCGGGEGGTDMHQRPARLGDIHQSCPAARHSGHTANRCALQCKRRRSNFPWLQIVHAFEHAAVGCEAVMSCH